MEETINKNILENEYEIVKQAQTDDLAFEILYDFYFPKIYGYVYKRVGNKEDAEDIVSVTFMKVFNNLSTYSHKGASLGAWIFKIATNNIIDFYRKKGRSKGIALDDAPQIVDKSIPLPEQMQVNQDMEVIMKVLSKLSKKYQKVLYLRFFAQLSHEEVAQTMGISQNNCRVLTFRAMKRFKKEYKELGIGN